MNYPADTPTLLGLVFLSAGLSGGHNLTIIKLTHFKIPVKSIKQSIKAQRPLQEARVLFIYLNLHICRERSSLQ